MTVSKVLPLIIGIDFHEYTEFLSVKTTSCVDGILYCSPHHFLDSLSNRQMPVPFHGPLKYRAQASDRNTISVANYQSVLKLISALDHVDLMLQGTGVAFDFGQMTSQAL